MGLIHLELFATLDLVAQAPGGPEEDPAGFRFGGWQAPLIDETVGASDPGRLRGHRRAAAGPAHVRHLRAAYWPHQKGGPDNEIATLFNSIPKYVASRGKPDLPWDGSTQLGPDLADAVRELRERHENIKVVGSLDLVQSLLRERLFDRIDLWLHPIVLGAGKKVFEDGAVPTNVTLLGPPVASSRAPCTCATGSPTASPPPAT
ncbi:dihydrofolate reductase family protein [Streptomyces sp. KL116D]|uniref:dihydrofolate reductase family protein n=1 Tax=Streptomyces sp. KL116D TaxID=3045152 RepID=UPI003556347C